MDSYSLAIKRSAQRELDSLDDATFSRVDRKILALANDPRPPGCKKLRGFRDYWRVRVGDYRVIYIVDDESEAVTITRIAHRREVYE